MLGDDKSGGLAANYVERTVPRFASTRGESSAAIFSIFSTRCILAIALSTRNVRRVCLRSRSPLINNGREMLECWNLWAQSPSEFSFSSSHSSNESDRERSGSATKLSGL
jgi:hypothetical protein